MSKEIRIENFPLKEETDLIIGIGIEIHKILGHGFLEIVYKDAFEYEFRKRLTIYEREKEFSISYKEVILPHKFFAILLCLEKSFLRSRPKMEFLMKTMHKQLIILNARDARLD